MFKIGIENYTVYGRHGAYEFEHENPQPFIVTIWVEITNHRFLITISILELNSD